MQTPVNEAVVRAKLMVWWVIWFSMISGLCVLYFFLARPVAASETVEVGLFDYFPLVPLAVSVVIRWFVLPKCARMPFAFVAFIAGISLAEGCAILGIFLARAHTDELFILGVLGIAQFAPFYARRFIASQTV